jgi:hypothetical protein
MNTSLQKIGLHRRQLARAAAATAAAVRHSITTRTYRTRSRPLMGFVAHSDECA